MDDEIFIGIDTKSNSNKKNKNIPQNGKTTKKKNANRTPNNKKTKLFGIISICTILIVIIFGSSLFDIKEFEIIGNDRISDEMIISLSGLELYNNIFRFNKSSTIKKIKENSYIKKVKISRKLPSKIQITVEETTPKYMLQIADSYAYINNQGYILEISTEKLQIPILEGVHTDISNAKSGDRINIEDLKKMDMVIKIYETAKSNGLGNLITKIDISDDRNYKILMESEGKTVYLGEGLDLNTRILYLKSILEASTGKNGEIFLNVDLNSENVFFRPSSN